MNDRVIDMMLETHENDKKLSIVHGNDTITVKIKHIPIFVMMLQKHYGPFSVSEKFGKHKVEKTNNGQYTTVFKRGDDDRMAKYVIGNFEDGTKLFGTGSPYWITVTEEDTNKLILMLSDYYIEHVYGAMHR